MAELYVVGKTIPDFQAGIVKLDIEPDTASDVSVGTFVIFNALELLILSAETVVSVDLFTISCKPVLFIITSRKFGNLLTSSGEVKSSFPVKPVLLISDIVFNDGVLIDQ